MKREHRDVIIAAVEEQMIAVGSKSYDDGMRSFTKLIEFLKKHHDPMLHCPEFTLHKDNFVSGYCHRVLTRLLPREVLGFVPNMFSHIPGEVLKDFTSRLLDKDKRVGAKAVQEFERAFGEELLRLRPELGKDWQEALWTAGAWLDVPSPPKFENVELIIGESSSGPEQAVRLSSIFPIRYWIQAYEAHRYHVRVFSFSEYAKEAAIAAKHAMKQVLAIDDDAFYDSLLHER